MTDTYVTERTLQREVSERVEAGIPGIEVLALELVSPQRFCVYVDHPTGVDHALCERVTSVLRGYLDRYSVDVSSPGLERPLRKPAARCSPPERETSASAPKAASLSISRTRRSCGAT